MASSEASGDNNNNGGWEGSDVEFLRILDGVTGPQNLTRELEQTGRITTYITTTPKFQKFERDARTHLLSEKKNAVKPLKNYDDHMNIAFSMAAPKELLQMKFEDIVEIIEKARGVEIDTFEDLLQNMQTFQGDELNDLINETAELNTRSMADSDVDLFDEFDSPVASGMGGVAKSVGSTKFGASKGPQFMFPSSKDMAKTNPAGKFTTPSGKSVFNFGSSLFSSSKAPRLAKPGEQMFYSESGSPVLLPRLPKVPAGVPERIKFNAEDGKQIVEVVLYQGAEDKGKEFKEFVTDVRGLVALKSCKSNRIVPPRLPTRGGPSSAKKPQWH